MCSSVIPHTMSDVAGPTARSVRPTRRIFSMIRQISIFPIGGIVATFDESAETGMRPIHRPVHQSMSNRILMNVFDVRNIIPLVTNKMLPEPVLPNLALLRIRKRTSSHAIRESVIPARKFLLDQHPSNGKIAVAIGKRPNGMQMVGQDHIGIQFEGVPGSNMTQSVMEQSDGTLCREDWLPIASDDSEGIDASANSHPAVAHEVVPVENVRLA